MNNKKLVQKKYYNKNKELLAFKSREWAKKNPEKRQRYLIKNRDKILAYYSNNYKMNADKMNASRRKRWHENPDQGRNIKYKLLYGIDLDNYNKLFELQNGRCAICLSDKVLGQGKFLHVDHDHKTGKVRGLLCNSCNFGLGSFKDNPEFLKKAIEYLIFPS